MIDLPISRGFFGRKRPEGQSARIPPGQHLTHDFPVLSAGPTPVPDLASWSFTLSDGDSDLGSMELGRVRRAAADRGQGRHPLRHHLVEARHQLAGRHHRHAARSRRPRRAAGALRDDPLRRRLHDQCAGRGHGRRQGDGRDPLRGPAARPRAWRPGAAARAASLFLEERQMGDAASTSWRRTSPASGNSSAITSMATPGENSAMPATERRRAARPAPAMAGRARCARIVDETPRVRSLILDLPGLARAPAGPACRHPPDRRGRLPGAAQLFDRLGARSARSRASPSSASTTARSRPTSPPTSRSATASRSRGPIGGYFVWTAALGGPLFLVAGGSGIVPLMAMLRHRALGRQHGADARSSFVADLRGHHLPRGARSAGRERGWADGLSHADAPPAGRLERRQPAHRPRHAGRYRHSAGHARRASISAARRRWSNRRRASLQRARP